MPLSVQGSDRLNAVILGGLCGADVAVECRHCRFLVRNNPEHTDTESEDESEECPTDEAEAETEESPLVALHKSLGLCESFIRAHTGVIRHNVVDHRVAEVCYDTRDDEEE